MTKTDESAGPAPATLALPDHHAQRPRGRPVSTPTVPDREFANFWSLSLPLAASNRRSSSASCRTMPTRLRREILGGKEQGVDVIFTTGGTGVGPRDIAPRRSPRFATS